MNTKRILTGVVTGLILTGSLAMAAPRNDRARSKATVRTAKHTTTMTNGSHATVRRRSFGTGGNRAEIRTRRFATGGNTATVRTRDQSRVFVGGRTYGYSYPYRSYGYGYGYPYYSYGPSVSCGFGYPYYSYGYPYGYYGSYPSDYSYGYYSYDRSGYGSYANGSVVIHVQWQLARAGYHRGESQGALRPRPLSLIEPYEGDLGHWFAR